jgi:DNA-binding NtrC family response regulator
MNIRTLPGQSESRSMPLDILIVDDDVDNAQTIADALAGVGHHPATVTDGTEAIHRLHDRAFDVLICDIRLPGVDGMTILKRLRAEQIPTEAIMMSAYGTIPEAVDALKLDAVQYLPKPFSLSNLLDLVDQIARRIGLDAVRDWARTTVAEAPETGLVGQTAMMVGLRKKLAIIARADGPVLITGETGVGKELVARTIHQLSHRAAGPFVAINSAAFPETLIEAELFGYERGAFTGAAGRREGRFAAACGGSLFLDEVGEIAPATQAKLLRVLEDGSYQRLGSDQTVGSDVRAISATNVDLSDGLRFRRDLYYRLKLFHVEVPPLRDRRADIALLVEHFCSELLDESPQITSRAWAALLHYDYPGNVRQLRHAIAHAVALSDGNPIDLEHLPGELAPSPERPSGTTMRQLRDAEQDFERSYLLRALRRTGWNRTQAAGLLGISRKTLWKKMRKLRISEPVDA